MPKMNAVVVEELVAEEVEGMAVVAEVSADDVAEALASGDYDLYSDLHKEVYGRRP